MGILDFFRRKKEEDTAEALSQTDFAPISTTPTSADNNEENKIETPFENITQEPQSVEPIEEAPAPEAPQAPEPVSEPQETVESSNESSESSSDSFDSGSDSFSE